MRIPFVKQYNLEEFEFSQAYLFFWDKVCFSIFYINAYFYSCRYLENIYLEIFLGWKK